MHARRDYAIALAVACAAAMIGSSIPIAQARAQDIGFGLGDPYRTYADPGNGGGSAYAPFFNPYRGNRIVRGAYPDAYYDGHGYHYGKSAPPSLDVDSQTYDSQSYPSSVSQDHRDRYRLREGETMTTRIEVEDPTRQPVGTIIVDTASRHLYLVERSGRALQYGIGVGRQGFAWHGTARIGRKMEWPSWKPPGDMLRRRPDLPLQMKGGIDNPLGARALYLYQGSRDTMFRIHGTNEPDTIGQAVSSGCIRMMNVDVIDLYDRVKVGATVSVLQDRESSVVVERHRQD